MNVWNLKADLFWNFKKIVESDLGTGHVATPSGRPTHSRRAKSFNHICQVAQMYTHLVHDSFGQSLSPSQTAARSVQPGWATFCLYVTLRCAISPKFPPPVGGSGPSSSTSFLGVPDLYHPKRHLDRVGRFFHSIICLLPTDGRSPTDGQWVIVWVSRFWTAYHDIRQTDWQSKHGLDNNWYCYTLDPEDFFLQR